MAIPNPYSGYTIPGRPDVARVMKSMIYRSPHWAKISHAQVITPDIIEGMEPLSACYVLWYMVAFKPSLARVCAIKKADLEKLLFPVLAAEPEVIGLLMKAFYQGNLYAKEAATNRLLDLW